MGEILSALTFAPDLGATDLFYMAEDLGGGIFFERKVEMSQLDSRWVNTSGDTMTGALSLPDGTVGAPSLRFTSDPGLGIYLESPGRLGLAGAVLINGPLEVVGEARASIFFSSDGDAVNPSHTFLSDPSTGIYLTGAGDLGFTTAGVQRMQISATEVNINGNAIQLFASGAVNFAGAATSIDALGHYVGPTMEIETQLVVQTGAGAEALTRFMVLNVDTSAEVFKILGSGEVLFFDDIRQTFNPGATVAGFNFGSVAADPSTPINSDAWYQSTANELRFRINGATVSFPTATTPLAVTRGGTGTATQFTPGSVIFAGPSEVYAEDNANFFWDDSGNQLFLGGATAAAADTLLGANGSAIFNEQGSSVDFRVESDTKTHMLFVQGSTNRIGINTSAPTQMFELWGTQNTANRYLLFDDTNWIRFQFQSSHATIGTIWNLTSGKDWYFGEAVDLGTYFFRGRNFDIGPAVSTTGAPANFKFTGAAHTGLTLSTEVIDAHFSLSRSVQHATGALATQRAFVITNPTYAFVGGSTITNAATFAILGAPVAGSNATITNSYSLWVQAGTSRFDGNISMGAAKTLSFVSGTDQRAGNAVLVAGTITVNNTTVTANTIVMLTRKTSGGTIGTAITYTVSAGNSFTITSDSVLDTSTFSYLLIEVP